MWSSLVGWASKSFHQTHTLQTVGYTMEARNNLKFIQPHPKLGGDEAVSRVLLEIHARIRILSWPAANQHWTDMRAHVTGALLQMLPSSVDCILQTCPDTCLVHNLCVGKRYTGVWDLNRAARRAMRTKCAKCYAVYGDVGLKTIVSLQNSPLISSNKMKNTFITSPHHI